MKESSPRTDPPLVEAGREPLILLPWGGDNGIFFHKSAYERLSGLQLALRDSKTWGEFRAAVGDDEFFGLNLWIQHDGEYVYGDSAERYLGLGAMPFEEFCEPYEDEYEDYIIRPADPFQADEVPGFSDGDYPPWLYSTAEEALPEGFRREFGEPVSSMVSGSWWEFPLNRFNEMAEALRKLGFEVELVEADF